MTISPSFLRRIQDTVGDGGLLLDADAMAGYCRDWTGRFHGSADAVVRPRSTQEVAEVVRACRAEGVGLVPQGPRATQCSVSMTLSD